MGEESSKDLKKGPEITVCLFLKTIVGHWGGVHFVGHEKTDLGTKECVTNGQGSTWEEDEFSSFCFKRQFISPKIYVYYLEKLENTDMQEEEKKQIIT